MRHLEISSAMLTLLNAATAPARFASTTNTRTTRNMIANTVVPDFTRRGLDLLRTMCLAAVICKGASVHAADGPPVILQQPVNLSARQGESAQHSLDADGCVPR